MLCALCLPEVGATVRHEQGLAVGHKGVVVTSVPARFTVPVLHATGLLGDTTRLPSSLPCQRSLASAEDKSHAGASKGVSVGQAYAGPSWSLRSCFSYTLAWHQPSLFRACRIPTHLLNPTASFRGLAVLNASWVPKQAPWFCTRSSHCLECPSPLLFIWKL